MSEGEPRSPSQTEAEKNVAQRRRIFGFLMDYRNNYIALGTLLAVDGIKKVHEAMREGYRIPTIEKHIEQYEADGRPTVEAEDKADPEFIQAVKDLNALATELNDLGEEIEEAKLGEITEKSKEIAYRFKQSR